MNMKIFKILLFSLLTFTLSKGQTGSVGINTQTPDPSAVLHIESQTKGLLTPRMTTLQRTGIASPAYGLLVFDTDLKSFL